MTTTARSTTLATSLASRIAAELGVREDQVAATIEMLDEGATVPFIARYRKERTGGLDDIQLRELEERLTYLRELDARKETVLEAIQTQGKLTAELEAAIRAADTKTRLEDLYRPYKVKRRTKAQIARERGLGDLAERLLGDPTLDPAGLALEFVDPAKDVPDADAALEGARDVLVETFCDDPELSTSLREHAWENASAKTVLESGHEESGARFRDYFEYSEPLKNVPSHRALAMLRGRTEGAISLNLVLDPEDKKLGEDSSGVCVSQVMRRFGIADEGRPADGFLTAAARLAWRFRLALRIETDLVARLREAAELSAIDVFAQNLKALLLAAPAGPVAILGLDPGLRTGVKVAVVDRTGQVVATDTIYPTPPRNDIEGSLRSLEKLVKAHSITLVSVGNGTGSRETDRLVTDLMRRMPDVKLQKIITNEAGASVYSASELASKELPHLDVSLRGAASIARRVQDPLAELVKIEPKAIGVGQYQHDVDQSKLSRSLVAVVEDCVNAVGVDVNTASAALLERVAGMTKTLAENLVTYRNEHAAFRRRKDILKVPRLGPKAYEQAAGFLRIMGADNPLDGSSVHPEAYPVVERIAKKAGRDVASIVGDSGFLRSLNPADYVDASFGLPTVTDILRELEKPGRDPRPEFKTAAFKEGVERIQDLAVGMKLEGVVTNVTDFGAFVDVGVHQDGLVHISQMSHTFIKSPSEVVKAGDIVHVKVMSIDLDRNRIAMSMRMDDDPAAGGRSPQRDTGGEARGGRGPSRRGGGARRGGPRSSEPKKTTYTSSDQPIKNNPFAKAFAEKGIGQKGKGGKQ